MITNRLLVRRITSWIAASGARRAPRSLAGREPAILSDEFIFTRTPDAMSHASSIAKCGDALVATWFAGSLESRPDVGIWVARNEGHGWSRPVEVAHGKQDDGSRHACWNPVLFQPAAGPLLLFYKVGRTPRSWRGLYLASHDGGCSWTAPQRLPEGILGPIKNKPVQLASGVVLSPSSVEDDGWRIHLERGTGHHGPWERSGPLNDGRRIAAIQPSILTHGDGRLQLLSRTKHGRIAEAWSHDDGATWSAVRLTALPNPNSGTDAVSLADGRHLLVYNRSRRRRTPLVVALSRDGKDWREALVLARGNGEYSYPAVIQAPDGLVHVTYTWNLSRIRHVVIDPGKLRPNGA